MYVTWFTQQLQEWISRLDHIYVNTLSTDANVATKASKGCDLCKRLIVDGVSNHHRGLLPHYSHADITENEEGYFYFYLLIIAISFFLYTIPHKRMQTLIQWFRGDRWSVISVLTPWQWQRSPASSTDLSGRWTVLHRTLSQISLLLTRMCKWQWRYTWEVFVVGEENAALTLMTHLSLK